MCVNIMKFDFVEGDISFWVLLGVILIASLIAFSLAVLVVGLW